MPAIQMKLRFLAIAAAGSFLVAISLPGMARADGPSLAETLAWMDSTYNPHAGGSPGYGSLIKHTSAGGDPFFVYNEVFTYRNCDMTVILKSINFRDGKNEGSSTYIYDFSLRDVDPDSFKSYPTDSQYPGAGSLYGGMSCGTDFPGWVCDTEEMDFNTRNQKPLIKEEDLEMDKTGKLNADSNNKTSSAYFLFSDLNYAVRFSKAFSHAVKLCGGESSTF